MCCPGSFPLLLSHSRRSSREHVGTVCCPSSFPLLLSHSRHSSREHVGTVCCPSSFPLLLSHSRRSSGEHKHSVLSQFISTRARPTRRPATALTFLARFDFTCTPKPWSRSPTHWAWRYCVARWVSSHPPPPPTLHNTHWPWRHLEPPLTSYGNVTTPPPPPPHTHTLTVTSPRASVDVLRKRHDPPPPPPHTHTHTDRDVTSSLRWRPTETSRPPALTPHWLRCHLEPPVISYSKVTTHTHWSWHHLKPPLMSFRKRHDPPTPTPSPHTVTVTSPCASNDHLQQRHLDVFKPKQNQLLHT